SMVIESVLSTVAEAAMAPAMISLCTRRLCTRASIRPARNCERYITPVTSAMRPARFRKTMRRVSEEKLCETKKPQAERTGRRIAAKRRGFSVADAVLSARSASAFGAAVSAVRSSTRSIPPRLSGSTTPRFYRKPGRPVSRRRIKLASSFLEAVADAVQRLDHLEVVVDRLELLAQPLDVAVDGAVVDIDLVVIGGVHQRVAALDHAGARRQRLENQELGDGECHRLVLPGAGVALRVHAQQAALEYLGGIDFLDRRAVLRAHAPQHRLHALDEEALRERFADEIVGAHLQAEQFVDLLVLGGEEDDGDVGLLTQPPQRLHAVHARHLDVEDGKVRRRRLEAVEGGGAVGIGHDAVALRLEGHRYGRQDVAVVVDEGNGRQMKPLPGYSPVPL